MSTASMSAPPPLRAAFVKRPHGVRGQIRVEPLGGDAARFSRGLRLRVEDGGRELVVREARGLGDGDVLLGLEGIDDRAAAEALRDAYLCVAGSQRRSLAADEWFTFELIGLRARTPDGEAVGVVDDIEHYPEQDTLVIRRHDGKVSRLPLVRAFVQQVDIAAGEVLVTPWPGDEAGPS
jgi:16S rRNA processing protein RimM